MHVVSERLEFIEGLVVNNHLFVWDMISSSVINMIFAFLLRYKYSWC